MSSDFDASEFVDGDLESRRGPYSPGAGGSPGALPKAPTREEVDTRVMDAQQKLAQLRKAQEELEREKASLEETRRRQAEFQTGRQEMVTHLTRGLGLLEEAELNARREAEQMARTIEAFRQAVEKIQAIREETWKDNTFQVELTRALTTLENARMEWNAARLKFPLLASAPQRTVDAEPAAPELSPAMIEGRSFGELCRLGFALTWPVALAVTLGCAAILVALLNR